MISVAALWRHPLKGHGREPLDCAQAARILRVPGRGMGDADFLAISLVDAVVTQSAKVLS